MVGVKSTDIDHCLFDRGIKREKIAANNPSPGIAKAPHLLDVRKSSHFLVILELATILLVQQAKGALLKPRWRNEVRVEKERICSEIVGSGTHPTNGTLNREGFDPAGYRALYTTDLALTLFDPACHGDRIVRIQKMIEDRLLALFGRGRVKFRVAHPCAGAQQFPAARNLRSAVAFKLPLFPADNCECNAGHECREQYARPKQYGQSDQRGDSNEPVHLGKISWSPSPDEGDPECHNRGCNGEPNNDRSEQKRTLRWQKVIAREGRKLARTLCDGSALRSPPFQIGRKIAAEDVLFIVSLGRLLVGPLRASFD